MEHYCTLICLSLLVSVSDPLMLDKHFIQHVLGQFTIINPLIVSTNLTKTTKVKLLKLFSTNDQRTQIVNWEAKTYLEKYGMCSKMLVVPDVTKVNIKHFLVGTTCPVLVLLTSDLVIEEALFSVQIVINQKVYFLSAITNQVFETYNVNNITIVRKLGMFEAVKNTSKLMFNPESGVETDFVQRRSDFQGLALKAMVEVQSGDLMLTSNFEANGTIVDL
jgi:actin-related protein